MFELNNTAFVDGNNRLLPLRNFILRIGGIGLVKHLDSIVHRVFGKNCQRLECKKLLRHIKDKKLYDLVEAYKEAAMYHPDTITV